MAVGLLLGATPLGVAVSASAVETEKIGRVELAVRRVVGELGSSVDDLYKFDAVYRDQVVRTYPRSAAELRFEDGTVVSVGPESQLVLDRFVYAGEADPTTLDFAMVKGVFRFVSGKSGGDAVKYRFQTPTATIGIRGTIAYVAVQADGTTSIILESDSLVDVSGTVDGGIFTLDSKGDAATVGPGGVVDAASPAPGWARDLVADLTRTIDDFVLERPTEKDGNSGGPSGPNN